MKKFIFLTFAILLSSCAGKELPAELMYSKTAADIKNPATIRGFNEESSIFDDDTSFIYSIDGKVVKGDKKDWVKDIPIEPGERRIGAQFRKGSHAANTIIPLRAEAGGHYALKHVSPGNIYAYDGASIQIWIVDLVSGKAVSDVFNAGMNSSGGGGVIYSPVYVKGK